jgi:hypothetical protein
MNAVPFKVRVRSNLFRKLPKDHSFMPIGTGYELINSYEGEGGGKTEKQ